LAKAGASSFDFAQDDPEPVEGSLSLARSRSHQPQALPTHPTFRSHPTFPTCLNETE